MPLKIIEPAPGPDARIFWEPFDPHPGFHNTWWGPRRVADAHRYSYARFFRDDVEEARIELDHHERLQPVWSDVPDLWGPVVEVQYIEVRTGSQGNRIGTDILGWVADQHPGAVLIAFSPVDRFWMRVGWSQHFHAEDDGRGSFHRLFIGPEPSIC